MYSTRLCDSPQTFSLWWNNIMLTSYFIDSGVKKKKEHSENRPQTSTFKFKLVSSTVKCENLIVAWWRHMATQTGTNIGSGNGLLSSNSKPLTAPMLTYHWWSSVAFTWEQFHREHLHGNSVNMNLKILLSQSLTYSPGANRLNWMTHSC